MFVLQVTFKEMMITFKLTSTAYMTDLGLLLKKAIAGVC